MNGRAPEGVVWCAPCANRHRAVAVDADRRQRIIAAVTTADAGLDRNVIEAALADVAGSRNSLGRLDRHLTDHPDTFTVGPTTTVPIVDRFTAALAAAGAAAIFSIDPICASCGRQHRWHARTDTGGVCSTCHARTRREPCARCGRARRVDHRDHGEPVCEPCARSRRRHEQLDQLAADVATAVRAADPTIDIAAVTAVVDEIAWQIPARAGLARHLAQGSSLSTPARRVPPVAQLLDRLRTGGALLPPALCEDCAGPAEPLIVHLNIVRCRPCAQRCPDCGGNGKEPFGTRCSRCDRTPRGTCTGCGHLDRALDIDDRCRTCRERAERCCVDCGAQAPRTLDHRRWLCQACALVVDLDEHLGPVGALSAPLVAVRAAIMAADNPTQVRSWLRASTGGAVLAQLAAGTMAMTHQALDAHGPNDASIGFLRALLVAAEALPAEDRAISRFEAFVAGRLDDIADPAARTVVRSWLRWKVLPRLRARDQAGKSMVHSVNNARNAVRQVTAMLATLAERDTTLPTCTQSDVDSWFATGGAGSWLARPFLVWAADRHHLAPGITIPATPPQARSPVLDEQQRWVIARRLVTDDTIDVDARVAGALVVLYGQPVARIAALTTSDIHRSSDGTTIVALAGNPVPIHEPFATLIAGLPVRRTNGMSDQLDQHGWLFPGRHAGRHISPNALGLRLRRIGIEALAMRNSARAQLAAEIPPALFGELIGISATTATRWAVHTAGNWTSYAADIATP